VLKAFIGLLETAQSSGSGITEDSQVSQLLLIPVVSPPRDHLVRQ
jgi:hypothetical protein